MTDPRETYETPDWDTEWAEQQELIARLEDRLERQAVEDHL